MNKLWEHIDAKTITAGGGILTTLYIAYILFKVLTNDLTHLNQSIQSLEPVLRQNASAIEGNTEVLRILERRLK